MLYKLYLDETGTANPSDVSQPYFVLSGVIVEEGQSDKLKAWADRIKFKYWSDLNPPHGFLRVVFHSREIGRREKDFSILKNPAIENGFHKDLVHFLNGHGFKCIIVCVNKTAAKKSGWTIQDVYEKSSDEMVKLFIEFLHKRGSGRVVIESSGTQKDLIFYKKYIHYLADGFPTLGLSHHKIKSMLTSISFVTKNNFDIETQIADLLAYPAGYKCLVNENKRKLVVNSYEDKMCQVLQVKTIKLGTKICSITIP